MELAIVNDKQRLEQLESVIQKNLQSFYEVGRALMEIRDNRLYEKVRGIANFETYCRERWDMSKPRAYQLIEAAEINENLSTIVDEKPTHETQLRPLSKIKNPEQQREVWKKAIDTAPQGKITERHVQKVVREVTEDKNLTALRAEAKAIKRAERNEGCVEMRNLRKWWRVASSENKLLFASWVHKEEGKLPVNAVTYAKLAMEQLRRISDNDPHKGQAIADVRGWLLGETQGTECSSVDTFEQAWKAFFREIKNAKARKWTTISKEAALEKIEIIKDFIERNGESA